MEKIEIRASGLGRYATCKESFYHLATNPNSAVQINSKYSTEGSKMHNDIQQEFLKYLANVPYSNNPYLLNAINFLNQFVKNEEQRYVVEERFEWEINEKFVLRGTPDLVYCDNKQVIVIDYKTGNFKIDPMCLQLQAYAYLVLQNLFPDKEMEVYLCVIQDNEARATEMIYASQLIESLEGVLESVCTNITPEPTPYTCKQCPFVFECSNTKEVIRRLDAMDVNNLTEEEQDFYIDNRKFIKGLYSLTDNNKIFTQQEGAGIVDLVTLERAIEGGVVPDGWELKEIFSKHRSLTEVGRQACRDNGLVKIEAKPKTELAKEGLLEEVQDCFQEKTYLSLFLHDTRE